MLMLNERAGGRRHGGAAEGGCMQAVDVPHEHRGFWRVEQEWVNAMRGREAVKLTDFATGVRYMEFTEAVARSAQSGQAVSLPLLPSR